MYNNASIGKPQIARLSIKRSSRTQSEAFSPLPTELLCTGFDSSNDHVKTC